jgi:hypothetical protein
VIVQDERTSGAGLLFVVMLMFGFLGWWLWPTISTRVPELERVRALVDQLLPNELAVARGVPQAAAAAAAAEAVPTPTTVPPPTALAVLAPYCPPGQAARFVLGFASLKEQLGDTMGEPLECEHANPENGDHLQATSTGLAVFNEQVGLVIFTNGWQTWTMLPEGVVSWTANQGPPETVAGLLARRAAPAKPAVDTGGG